MTHIPLPHAVTMALETLEQAGYPAYVVGGCVRDGLRGISPQDWDVCTAARPEQVQTILADAFTVLPTGLQHGTVTAVRDNLHIEITTYRVEAPYSDGRRPDGVTFIDRIEDDLQRRDFTVGAIAYSPTWGICDPFGGRQDLAQGILRCVGNPVDRFTEDALRIARAMRLSSEHGFSIAPDTAAAMQQCMGQLAHIAKERLLQELTRLLCGRYVGRVLRRDRHVLAQLLPEIIPMFDLAQQSRHHQYDVWEHTVRTVEQIPPVPALRWAMLLHDSGKPACKTVDAQGVGHFKGHAKVSCALTERIATRFLFSTALREEVLLLVQIHDIALTDIPHLLRRRLAQYGETHVRALLAVKKADAVGKNIDSYGIALLAQTECMLNDLLAAHACVSLQQLAINGNDLLNLGMHGQAIGQTLHQLLQHVLEYPEDNEKQTLLALAQDGQP